MTFWIPQFKILECFDQAMEVAPLGCGRLQRSGGSAGASHWGPTNLIKQLQDLMVMMMLIHELGWFVTLRDY